MGTVLLSVRDCSFGYKGSDFRLRDVSLEVSRGEVLGIIGPNGSGKSTLLRLMGGFQRPDGGEVSLQGAPIRSFSRRELARDLAFLPQNPETSFRFSVRQVVAMGRYPYLGSFAFLTRHDVEVVERALSETESTGFGEVPPNWHSDDSLTSRRPRWTFIIAARSWACCATCRVRGLRSWSSPTT